jgi:hypothetical protein
MRLQLDSTSAGASGGVGPTAPAGGSGSNSNRIGPGTSGSGDSIEISGASSALNTLAANRAAQILQLTSAVQSGSYQVSSSLVGNVIVEHGIT